MTGFHPNFAVERQGKASHRSSTRSIVCSGDDRCGVPTLVGRRDNTLFGFGATVDAETSQLMVLGHSSGPGLMALLLSICATLALALSRLRLAAFFAMMGVIWTGFSVGHYLMPDLVQDGNKGMTVGVGPLIFGLGSLLVLTVSAGRAQWRSTVAAWLLTVVLFVLCWDGPTVDMSQPFYVPEWLWPMESRAGSRSGLEPGDGCCAVWIVDPDAFGMACSGILWASMLFGVFFALYSGGDWMRQLRWFSLVSVSLMPLIAIGLATFIDAVPWLSLKLRLGHLWGPVAARVPGLPVLPDWLGRRGVRLGWCCCCWAFTSTDTVRSRNTRFVLPKNRNGCARYSSSGQLHELGTAAIGCRPCHMLDVDMGAHMYFSGWDIVDIAGLVDVPMARHSDFNQAFISEYIFGERNPEFAHVHGGWASIQNQ